MLILSALFVQCGGNPEADGDAAYANGKYNQALSHYLKVKKSNPQNAKINEKIALTYMHKGLDLFKKRHNLDAFVGNFDKAQDFIPAENISAQFKKEYSRLLYELAVAYHNTKPSNEIQQEKYFTRTLDLLDDALYYDENNSDAEKTLTRIKQDNFQQTFEKGIKFYQQAVKEKNPDLFLSAEYYINRAVSFDPENNKARKYLKKVRAKTVAILDYNTLFPLAVGDKEYNSGYWLLAFTAVNNSGQPFTFDPAKLKLVMADGKEIGIDADYTAKFKDGLSKRVTMQPRKQLDGTLAFKVARKKIEYLSYTMDDNKTIKKYFP